MKKKSKIKRVLFAAVDQAYRATGLTPKPGLWFKPKRWVSPYNLVGDEIDVDEIDVKENIWRRGKKIQGAACPLGALAVFKSYTKEIADVEHPDEAFEVDTLAPYLGLDEAYVDGFVWGFDHKTREPTAADRLSGDENPSNAYEHGIEDGRAIRTKLGSRVK